VRETHEDQECVCGLEESSLGERAGMNLIKGFTDYDTKDDFNILRGDLLGNFPSQILAQAHARWNHRSTTEYASKGLL
jgi:hypothetical protein